MRFFATNPSKLAVSPPRGFKRFFVSSSFALLAIAVLLATVAVLQYRWTTKASSAEEMRIGAQLESLMMKWDGDLYSEFSAICIAMQVGPDSGARDTWNDYLERYVEWNYALPHQSSPYVYRNPDLVGEIYIWETGGGSKPKLFWLDLNKRKIEASTVPAELVNLLPRLEANSANLPTAMDTWAHSGASADARDRVIPLSTSTSAASNPIGGWQFDVRTPAIVHPILHHGADKGLSIERPVDWIVITMDMNVLQSRVLPMLATRYFGGLDGLDYKAALIATGPNPRTIYSSDPDFGITNLSVADSSMSIFPNPATATANHPGRVGRNANSLRSAEWNGFVGPQWFQVIQSNSEPELWFLKLQHRGAPLQAGITSARRKDLAMSGILLLLLGGNIAVLTVAGGRALEFARFQMDFVASVSHELRTPLTAIFSAGENIFDGVVVDRPGLRVYGALIVSQARQLIKHVDRIMLFASIRSGKDRYNLRPLRLEEIFETARNATASLLEQESFILEEQVPPELPCVLGDPFAVNGCLENLITNAVKYGGTHRRIRIAATLRKIGHEAQCVEISVEDRGIGINGSELKQVFEPFYRSSEAVHAGIHGTGLGLALAKHLAEAMGGSLSVVSELGQGSVFTLQLQVARENHGGVSTVRPTEQSG